MRRLTSIAVVALVMALTIPVTFGQTHRESINTGPADRTALPDDPVSMGYPLSHWMKVIRNHPDESEAAFDAIFELGPRAWSAVPELIEIVDAPFSPIRMGVDSRRDIHEKLLDIHLRAGAVDCLGAIGRASGPGANAVIRWGLINRVIARDATAARDPFFIELVGIDVLERMRAAGAVARFGIDAAAAVQDLVTASDNEKRKFAAAILNDETVPIATEFMQSEDCEERMLGLSLLSAMWPVVSRDHLLVLKQTLSCTEFGSGQPVPTGTMFRKNP